MNTYWFECKLPSVGFVGIGIRAVHIHRATKILDEFGATKIWFHHREEEDNEEKTD